MNILPIILVSFGILFLCYSCLPASQICTRTKNKGWKVLLGLIGFFIFAYSVFLFYLIFQKSLSNVNLGISGILCSGSIFVVVVINYSLQSIRQLHQIATTERYNALHDSLTLLPNRVYCLEQLNQKISLNQPFSVITFDLHNFKQINDAMGHYCGDELLVQLSQRFKDILTEHYFLSRMDSDEFVVLCPQHSNSDIRKIIDKVESTLDKPFNIHGHWIMSSMSAGISIFPTDSQSADKLLQHSDIAMYKAKKMGQSFMLYHPMMDNDVKQKLTISNYLKPALSNKEFRLFYQPLINTKSSLTHGYEALIRWPQKDGSFIPPDLFIPIAEQSNIIKQLTHWVLIQASEDLKVFNHHNIDACIHINLSAKDLLENDLILHLTHLLDSGRIQAHQLVLEVTESAMLTDLSAAKENVSQLQSLGFSISLDDFGTGFSSLSLLREFPIHQIKIDRSFIIELANNKLDQAIVRSAIALAHGLGHTIVAEGVENSDSVAILKGMKCDYLQGYYFQRPQSIENIIKWTIQHNNQYQQKDNIHSIFQHG